MELKKKQKVLLNNLYNNSDLTKIELGKLLGVTRQTASNYSTFLEDLLIDSYYTLVNPNINNQRSFFLQIKTNPEEPEIISKLKRIKSTQYIDGIIGTHSLIVKFNVSNNLIFNKVLTRIDKIISKSRFQHYRIIETLKTYKLGGFNFSEKLNDIKKIKTIKLRPESLHLTEYPIKFYVQIMPKDLSKYNLIARDILAPHQNIAELYRTGQEFGILAVVRTESIEGYRSFIESLYQTGDIQDSISTLVIDEKMPVTFQPFSQKFNSL